MLENEINLIADKIGMTVGQMYEINLGYHYFVGISNLIATLAGVITFIIFIIITYKISKHDEAASLMMIMLSVIIPMMVGLIVAAILLTGIGPIMYPEYYAMQSTIEQVSSLMP